jgi:hypothetical protein
MEHLRTEYINRTYNTLLENCPDALMPIVLSQESIAIKAKRLREVAINKDVRYLAALLSYLIDGDKSGLDALQLYNVNRHLKIVFNK